MEEYVARWEEFFDEEGFGPQITALADAYPEERSLAVEYGVLDRFDTDLALYLLEHPQNALYTAERALQRFVPPTEEAEIRFRVRGLPRDLRTEIRALRAKHLGKLVSVEGLVRKATEVRPRLVEAVFQCLRCGAVVKEAQEGLNYREPLECYEDQGGCSRTASATKWKLLDEGSRYIDTQKLEVQEPPEELRGGEAPQRLVAYVEDDLTGYVNPGDRVVLNGVLRGSQRGRFSAKSTLFDIFVDANSAEMEQVEYEEIEITPEDEARIQEEAASGDVIRKIVGSIAPSIYGMTMEKEALALQLFGGVPKQLPDGRRIRGDTHLLLVGDPGTAKSELLTYMTKLSPRGIYASGKASSSAGLTAAAVRDEFGEGRWTLEAGALVLADKGLACLHPESEVLVDGRPSPIAALFDEDQSYRATAGGQEIELAPLNGEVVSFHPSEGKTANEKAPLICRRTYRGSMLRVRLKSGFELRLTPDHLVLDGETFDWRELQELGPGDKLVALQRLPGHEKPVWILDILPEEWIVQLSVQEKAELRSLLQKRLGSLAQVNRCYGLARDMLNGRGALKVAQFRRILEDLNLYDRWKAKAFSYGRSRGTERLRVSSITPDFAYLLGFIYGDGSVQVGDRRSSLSITQSTVHLSYIQRVLRASRSVSSRSWGTYERNTRARLQGNDIEARCYQMQMGSNLLAYLYQWLTGDDLRNLLRLDDSALRAFIGGVMDADGCISIRRSRNDARGYEHVCIDFLFSSSQRANQRFMHALRRLDVFSRLREKPGVYSVQVSSRRDANRLLDAIRPYSAKVKDLPSRRTKSSARHEEVPWKPLVEVLSGIKPRPTRLLPKRVQSAFYELRTRTRRPFKETVARLAEALGRWATTEQSTRLKALTQYDYALDEIVEVESEYHEGYVYDLRVPEAENFLCEGVCVHNCIDEIEKMNDQDRSAIHTAMEQQTIHVAKAGITATLQTRCAILAAANPTLGRFDENKFIAEQINLPPTLMSRFDGIFPIMDRPQAQYDQAMAEHILKGHLVGEQLRQAESQRLAPEPTDLDEAFLPYLEPAFLRKYVAYAKRIYPVLTDEAMDILKDKYLEIRKQGEGDGGTVPITPRQLEAFIRLAEASARARLSPVVEAEDAERSVRIIEYWLKKVTGLEGGFDIDIVATGVSSSQRAQMVALREIIAELSERDGSADLRDILEEAEERGIPGSRVEAWLRRWSQEGEVYSPAANKWKLVSRY